MGTSLTPEFWERFSVLLVVAVGMTAILTAVFTTAFDALTVRLRSRRPHDTTPRTPHRPEQNDHRMSAHC
ncbi:hypothetical protein [Streptomyces sp. HUAS TT20]|uniref:hypothetical protein n=1 Tax=Streptomyces sp. HUAS TT20 TaxID=3447509 RepID=UPI0021D95016|nr:hypothetical protein [Streptomyces sp. HUAS 15-9]UXY31763.1 hypothetical protein N8I87_37925 [Streptomyces sp. HUAS 15-9]